MDRALMSANRLTDAYEQGIQSFLISRGHLPNKMGLNTFTVRAWVVGTIKKVKVGELINHLLLSGINPNYKVWRMHSETEQRNDAPQVVSLQIDDINTE
ncbi:unnamed protein product [Rhodiola kirilowii]